MLLRLILLVAVALLGLLALRAWLLRRGVPGVKATSLDRAFARAGRSTADAVLLVVTLAAAFLVLLHWLDQP